MLDDDHFRKRFAERDTVSQGTLVYRTAIIPSACIADVPYTMKRGRQNYRTITTDPGEIVSKQ